VGYANSFDMIRTSACIGVWPLRGTGQSPSEATPEAPIGTYIFTGEQKLGSCYLSSGLIFFLIGGLLGTIKGTITGNYCIPIQVFGIVKASCLCIAAFIISNRMLLKIPSGAIANALIFSIVLVDPGVTLYINGLYQEFNDLLFMYIAFAAAIWCIVIDDSGKVFLILTIALFALGTSKIQHMLLPCVIVFPTLVLMGLRRRKMFRHTLLLAITCLLVLLAQTANLNRRAMDSIKRCNATNTILFTLLPSANTKSDAAKLLGLPQECLEHIGKNWYTSGLHQDPYCIEEVAAVSKIRILMLIANDPSMFGKIVVKGLRQTRPWIESLGQIEGVKFGRIEGLFFSLGFLLEKVPFKLYLALWFILGGLAASILLWALDRLIRGKTIPVSASATLILLSSLCAWAIFFSAILGDGYCALQKHTFLATPCLIVSAGTCVWYIASTIPLFIKGLYFQR
jgi:hypothetical protein